MSDNYGLWQLSPGQHENYSDIELLKWIAQFGALAPSTHNTQPWLCRIEKQSLVIRPDFTKSLPHADPTNRGLYISLGCFVTNVRCAAAKNGKSVVVQHIDKENEVEIRLKLKPLQAEDGVFVLLADQLNRRISDKNYYLPRSISPDKVKLLSLQNDQCEVHIITNVQRIREAAEQYSISATKLASPKEFRNELAQWLRPNNTKAEDGMPGFVANVPLVLSILGPFVLPFVKKTALIQVKKDSQKLRTSPSFAVIYSTDTTKKTWISVGEIYEVVALLASKLGISLTPMAAMVEEQSGVTYLKQFSKNLHPQFFFRLGYSGEETLLHTPRRKIVFQ